VKVLIAAALSSLSSLIMNILIAATTGKC